MVTLWAAIYVSTAMWRVVELWAPDGVPQRIAATLLDCGGTSSLFFWYLWIVATCCHSAFPVLGSETERCASASKRECL